MIIKIFRTSQHQQEFVFSTQFQQEIDYKLIVCPSKHKLHLEIMELIVSDLC